MEALASLFPLEVFPEGFSYSLLTPVLIGVILMALATETFGAGFSGLVVPGYLAPIFLLKPWSGFLITAEAIATYLLVRLISDGGCRLGLWSVFFGRDRFLALVLMGTFLRTMAEGYGLPLLYATLGDQLPAGFDFRGNLHSIGLISVPLLANMFWKTGVLDGIPPVLLPIAGTYAVMRWFLMPLTNFSVGRIELTYDSLAIDLLANPKSYILLMTAMIVASRAALRYGWDFNGIMVPALTALTLFEPLKLLATAIESYLIYKVAKAIVKLPIFESVTIEGPRKVLIGFLVGYSLKLGACHAAATVAPGYNALDLFGFGYMLPTLMAVKMIQKENAALVLGPTIVVSSLGAAAGSIAGFLLLQAVPTTAWFRPALPSRPAIAEAAPEREPEELERLLAFDRRLLVTRDAINGAARPWPAEEEAFAAAMASLRNALEAGADPREAAAAATPLLAPLGLRCGLARDRSGQPLLYVRERPRARPSGHGLFLLRPGARRALVLELPQPTTQPGDVLAAARLFERLECSALLIAGSHPSANLDGTADAVENPRTLFQAAHRVFRTRDVVSLRVAATPGVELAVVRELPASLDVRELREALGPVEVSWRRLPGRHCQAETAARGFAQLTLDPQAVLLLRQWACSAEPLPMLSVSLNELLPRPGASAARTAPATSEMLMADSALFTPMAGLAADARPDPGLLQELADRASFLGYELVWWKEPAGREPVLLLRDTTSPSRGTFFLRPGRAESLLAEAPHPFQEPRTAEVAAWLFHTLRARALLIGGGVDAASENASMFHLAHQVLAREGGHLAVQVRGFSREAHPAIGEEMVLSPMQAAGVGSERVLWLLEHLRAQDVNVALQDGGERLAPLAALSTAQEAYNVEFGAGPFAYLHVSAEMRRSYRTPGIPAEEESWRLSFLDTLGVPRRRGPLLERLARPIAPAARTPSTTVQAEIADLLLEFGRTRNPVLLASVQERLRPLAGSLEHLTDSSSGTGVYIVELPGTRLLHNPASAGPSRDATAGADGPVRDLLLGRASLLRQTP